jgi:excisionase family DNA binding protein
MTDKWLTVKEVAAYLKLSVDLVYKLSQKGQIPVSRIGNQWRFDREEIDSWMKSQRPRVQAKRRHSKRRKTIS